MAATPPTTHTLSSSSIVSIDKENSQYFASPRPLHSSTPMPSPLSPNVLIRRNTARSDNAPVKKLNSTLYNALMSASPLSNDEFNSQEFSLPVSEAAAGSENLQFSKIFQTTDSNFKGKKY